MGQEKLWGVQFGRGIAAVLVVLYHAGRMLALAQYAGHVPLGGLFAFGNTGVDFFFVLSGFIIFFVHGRDLGHPAQFGRYLWRRFSRIYPAYWVVTALLVAALVLRHHAWPAHIAESFALIPQPREPLLSVAWTLTYEMAFYLAFAVAILSRRAGFILGLLWLALIVVGQFAPFGWFAAKFLASPFCAEFALGALTAHLVLRVRTVPLWPFAVIGLAVFVGAAFAVDAGRLSSTEMPARVPFGLASALLIFAVARAERDGRLLVPRWAAFLGAASYSIYLTHTLVMAVAALVLARLGVFQFTSALAFFAAALVAVAAGCLFHAVVERPLQSGLRYFTAPRAKEAVAHA